MGQEKYSVYIHTTPSKKVYIGITCQPIKRRWGGGSNYRKCPSFYRAILKYGWDNITHEVIYRGLTKENAEQKEIDLIKQYDSTNSKSGYNCTNGGSHNGTMTESFKKYASEIKKGSNNPMYGKIPYNKGVSMTEEQKKVISKTKTGRKLTAEQKKAYQGINKGRKHTKKSLENMRKAHAYKGKAVRQYDLNNQFIKEYPTISEAYRQTGIATGSISQVCKYTNRKKAGGYKWQYA